MPHTKKMLVVTVDKSGNEVGKGEWVNVPEPDHFSSDGFSHIESYVTRLIQSTAEFTSLIIGTPDQQIAVCLWQRGGIPEFSLMIDWRSKPERVRAVRQFFSVRELSISQDYLAGNGGVPDATRCLAYFLPSDVTFITALTKDVLQGIYGVQEGDALDFLFRPVGE